MVDESRPINWWERVEIVHKCQACGGENVPAANFCEHCGERITPVVAPPIGRAQPSRVSTPVTPMASTKKSRRGLLGLLAALPIGAAGFARFGPSSVQERVFGPTITPTITPTPTITLTPTVTPTATVTPTTRPSSTPRPTSTPYSTATPASIFTSEFTTTILAASRGLQFQPPWELPIPTSGYNWVVVIVRVRGIVDRTVTLGAGTFVIVTDGERYLPNGSASLESGDPDTETLGTGAPALRLAPYESTNVWLAFEIPNVSSAGRLRIFGSGSTFEIAPYFQEQPYEANPSRTPGAATPRSSATPRRAPTSTPRRSGSSGSSSGSANIWGWTPYHEGVVYKVCTDNGGTTAECECVVDLAMITISGSTLDRLIDGTASIAEEEDFEETLGGIWVICSFQ
jgi:hypothetical protein